MLLSGVMSVLTLVVTIARTAPLTSPASNHSTSLLSGRGLDPCIIPNYLSHREHTGKKPDILTKNHYLDRSIQCLDESIVSLTKGREYGRWSGEVMGVAADRWRVIRSEYKRLHEEFEILIWMRYPSMETHLKRVFYVALKVGLYEIDSDNQRIPSTAETATADWMELEIARAILKRETIARERKDKNVVKELTERINALKGDWSRAHARTLMAPQHELEEAYARHNHAIRERDMTYKEMFLGAELQRFIFYVTDRAPLVGKDAEMEDYVETHVGKYLEPEMFKPQTHDTELLRRLDNFLDCMVRPSGPQTLIPEQISGDDEYARHQDLFHALSFRQMPRGYDPPWPNVYMFPGDAAERINVLEAELCRKYVLTVLDKERDPIDTVRRYLVIIRLGKEWNRTRNLSLFLPYVIFRAGLEFTLNVALGNLEDYLNGTQELPQDLRDEISQVLSSLW